MTRHTAEPEAVGVEQVIAADHLRLKTHGTATRRTCDLYGINNGLRRPNFLWSGLAAVKMLGQVTFGDLIHP